MYNLSAAQQQAHAARLQIDTLNAEDAELRILKPQVALLQAASDKLEAVVGALGVGVTKDSDIAGIVGKMLADNLQFRQNAFENTLKFTANDQEIARLRALTTEQNSAIDGYIETAREHAEALKLKNQEIALLNADKSTETPEIAKIKAELRESKLQTSVAESALANEQRLLGELNASSTAVEATNTELKRQLGLAEAAKAVTATAVNAKDEYIAALAKSIANMNSVLDIFLRGQDEVVDAAKLVIHRPVLGDGDPLMKSNNNAIYPIIREPLLTVN
jgi:hypothetical protein